MLKLPGGFGGSGKRYIVGFDLTDTSCGISYCSDQGDIRTVSLVSGSEEYVIPMALSKRHGAGQWFFGREAFASADAGESILVCNLFTKALWGEDTHIDGLVYGAESLFTLYLKRAFGLLQSVGSFDRMEAVMFTLPEVTIPAMELIRESLKSLHIKTDRIYFMSHSESFYHYVVSEGEDRIHAGPVLFTVDDRKLCMTKLPVNRHTVPQVVHAETSYFELPRDRGTLPDDLDSTLLKAVQGVSSFGQDFSYYLVGEEFTEESLSNSLKYMCGKGKVFGGTNLFSKGAVLALLEKTEVTDPGGKKKKNAEAVQPSFIFLGDDKLTSNIGIRLLSQGSEVYYALLDAGTCWYEAEACVEFYISGGNDITLSVSSITGGGNSDVIITLDEYTGELTRMKLSASMSDLKTLVVTIDDMGLGVFTKTRELHVTEEITLP
ncbi:MAG: hypothetical protein K5871_10115 [Lachnospiraceae bacterium]|nr:hypothetical protein [Lachnospiraceae bacterium]